MATPTTPRRIDALDVPAEQLAADVQRLAQQRAADGLLAEQRHQYQDLDVDSACCPPGFVCPAVFKPAGGAA